MKAILSVFLVVLASATQVYPLTQQVGGNCGATNIYDIMYFDITPWPPRAGSKAILTMGGEFLKSEFVQEVVLGTCINGMFWNYDPIDVNKGFNAREIVEFQFGIVFPTDKASYVSNVQLTAGDHICCWQFKYNIG